MQDGDDQKQPGNVINPGGSTEPADQSTQEFDNVATPSLPAGAGHVSWSASEFISHQKNANWYLTLAGVAIVFAALVFFLSRDKISSAMVIVVAVIFGFFAARQPRTLPYVVDEKGVSIGTKSYGYELFKSFAVLDEGAFSSIVLLPLKRFMPSITIYFPPENEDQIIEVLGDYLPQEQLSRDPLDTLMRKVRF